MQGWKDGRMEGWKDGRMEGWKDGRMERPCELCARLCAFVVKKTIKDLHSAGSAIRSALSARIKRKMFPDH
jgi:hypothetical protein